MKTLAADQSFEAALDAAFKVAGNRTGNASLVFEDGMCEIIIKDGSRSTTVELKNGDAEVYFFPLKGGNMETHYTAGSDAPRSRFYCVITFDRNGVLTIDARHGAKIKFIEPTKRRVRV